MPARRKSVPSYLPHTQSGRARAVWTDATGGRHQKLLPGPFESAESRAAFGRLQLDLAAAPLARPAAADPEGVTVAELLLAHLDHAERHYRRADGSHTPELAEYKVMYRLLRELYGTLPVREFTPLKVKSLRQLMLARGWSRSVINQRVGRVKRIMKWGVGEELVPVATYQALAAVTGLQRGRTPARETEPVRPVEPWVVRATTPHVLPTVAAMIEVQSLTGMRPGEVCTMRPCDLDTTGGTWTYRPEQHKTAWRGKHRTVTIGPRAQGVLRGYWPERPEAYFFSPARAVAEWHAGKRKARKTRVQPSQVCRAKKKPMKVRGECYKPRSYTQAIAKGVKKANARRADLPGWFVGPPAPPVPHWHPNQLRHSHATDVRKRFGLEAAQVVLGHSRADVTQVYAERNEELAATVAAKLG